MVQDYSDFYDKFHGAAKTMRSALIDRLQKAAPNIFHLPSEVFRTNYDRKNVPELKRLHTWDQDSALSSKPPVLFPPCVREKGCKGYETKMFQSPEMFLLIKALLFGISSLDSEKVGGRATYGKQWGITNIDSLPFYTIPTFALLTVFIISEDAEFTSEGTKSKRHWEDYFDYLRLTFYRACGSHEFPNIMRMCQEIVFSG
ncbi:hypothetical protein DXG03_009355 [Asterophora parasitica]|uniref:Uncharacterized protein n=1 Tax=Asterophora parasitica TaxID=117018 RepID=A0A9P7FZX2_9AGAR|nr:hypothetical protein DXG03_009355 [Asterophora parasitica]